MVRVQRAAARGVGAAIEAARGGRGRGGRGGRPAAGAVHSSPT